MQMADEEYAGESHSAQNEGRPNAPDIYYSDDRWKNNRRAVTDDSHGIAICRKLFHDADKLIEVTARIREKTDGITPPFSPTIMAHEGKKHKSNMPTGFLESIMGKVAPRLYSYVTASRYLYTAELPSQDPVTGEKILNRVEKTERLRSIATNTVRSWAKWYLWLVSYTEEVCRHGHCFIAWLDDEDWRPTLFRMDHGQVPIGTEIMDENVPFFVARDSYMVHELFAKIRDKEIAEEAGWNVENVVESIRNAVPKERPTAGEEGQQIEYEDLVRECSPSWAYFKEANTIEVFHLFATEYDGRVSQYMYDARSEKLLFKMEDRYAKASDVVIPVTFQHGNGRVHGSYGVGHLLWDLATQVEKARNAAMDGLRARGRMTLTVPSASDLNKARLIIQDDATWVVGAQANMNSGTLPDTVDAHITFDRYMRELALAKIGAFYPPPQIPGLERTATESNIAAMREEETRRSIVDYYLRHFSLIMQTIVRRLFNPNSSDEAAKAAYREALNTCSAREIEIWSNTPASASVIKFTRAEDMGIIQFLTTKIGNPRYNQEKLERIQTALTIGTSYADDIILPEEDQTVQAEAVRQQTLELLALEKGEAVPVSPRDNDEIHISMLMGEQDQGGRWGNGAIAALIASGNIQGAQAAMEHWSQHVEQMNAKGTLGEKQNDAKSFARQISEALQNLQMAQQQQNMNPQQESPIQGIPEDQVLAQMASGIGM